MLWELMRLYDWRIITYISSFPVPPQDRNLREEMWDPGLTGHSLTLGLFPNPGFGSGDVREESSHRIPMDDSYTLTPWATDCCGVKAISYISV
jgi:hypothetical protein